MWVELEGANQILHISERGQSTYVFTYTRTYRLVPVLYWFAHYMHVQKDTCTYAREGANQMHKLHAGGQSERSEPKNVDGNGSEEFFEDFLKKLIQRVQDDIVVKPSGTEIIKSHRIQIKPTPIWE